MGKPWEYLIVQKCDPPIELNLAHTKFNPVNPDMINIGIL